MENKYALGPKKTDMNAAKIVLKKVKVNVNDVPFI